jgi:signal transduction histidine kinase
VGVDQLNFKKVLIHTEVYNSIDTYKNELRQANFQVDVQVPDDLEIVSYATFIKIVLDNVIENAIYFRSRIPQLKV